MTVKVFLTLLLLSVCPVQAQEVGRIVYLGIQDDPLYIPQRSYTGLSLKNVERPVDGARVAMRGTRVLGRALGLSFELEEILLADTGLVADAIRDARSAGALAVLLDLPNEGITAAAPVIGADHLVINIRDKSDNLRRDGCAQSLLHTIPSRAMLTDAIAQHLRFMGWSRILVLRGQAAEDLEQTTAIEKSIGKFGLKIVDTREFLVTNDPRQRELSNIMLLTNGVKYDVIWLADHDGEFGRYVPFSIFSPRPVVGSEGLQPQAWHWTWERHGAPQLNQRFRRSVDRDMTSLDWAAWVAVRVVIEAVAQTRSVTPKDLADYVRSDAFAVDLYKGVRGNFRFWSGQLRQPILLATHNAVISRAPLDGFDHRIDTLDTLGIDRHELECG